MNFSIVTTSFPIDALVKEELERLCEESYAVDRVRYDAILNIELATDYTAKGFSVLVYNDEQDILVAAASAIDLMGLHTFEWSLLVHPKYRQIGLGTALYEALQKELAIRNANGQLALMMEQENGYGRIFLQSLNFVYSFSEANFEARAEASSWDETIEIRAFHPSDTAALIEVFCDAFGDDEQEAMDLIDYNASHEELCLWVAVREGEIVGSVTTRQDCEAQWITALAVHHKAQGQGVGTALINAVKQLAVEKGNSFVRLDVELDNERALAIYKKTGFIKAAQIDYFSKG